MFQLRKEIVNVEKGETGSYELHDVVYPVADWVSTSIALVRF